MAVGQTEDSPMVSSARQALRVSQWNNPSTRKRNGIQGTLPLVLSQKSNTWCSNFTVFKAGLLLRLENWPTWNHLDWEAMHWVARPWCHCRSRPDCSSWEWTTIKSFVTPTLFPEPSRPFGWAICVAPLVELEGKFGSSLTSWLLMPALQYSYDTEVTIVPWNTNVRGSRKANTSKLHIHMYRVFIQLRYYHICCASRFAKR